MSAEKIISTKQYKLTCPGAQSTKKKFVNLVIFCGQKLPIFPKSAIFYHWMAGRIASILHKVAHGGDKDSRQKDPFALLKWPMPY